MKKLPVITVDEWAQAEADYGSRNAKPIPKGWYTVRTYAESRNPPIALPTAGARLLAMERKGLAERKPFPAFRGVAYIYKPIKK